MSDALLRQWTLLKLIPRAPRTADDRGIPCGWCWTKEAPAFDLPRMDGTTALSIKLLEQFIPQLLPPTLRDHLLPWFRQADTVLAEHAPNHLGAWLDRVRVIPNSVPLLAPTIDETIARTVYQSLLEGRRFTAYDPWSAQVTVGIDSAKQHSLSMTGRT